MASVIERLLLPAECLVCRQLLPGGGDGRVVCAVCRHRWRPLARPWCDRCGQPGPVFGSCRVCAAWPAALERARSAVWLDAGAREAVHALKYGGLAAVAADLAEVMVQRLPAPPADAVLVPVPLGRRRARRRGYNQSAVLARALGRRWALAVREDLLERGRETATQTALTPAERAANVAGAFRTRQAELGTRNGRGGEGSAFHVPRSELILVDDVLTTGATLAECARALAAGARTPITAVTFGRALVPDFL